MPQAKSRQKLPDKAEQILAGAMQQFLEYGYTGSSMDRIAAAAGVSKQTLYSYFHNKEALFTTLVEQIAKERFRLVFGSEPLQGEPSLVLRQLATKLIGQIVEDEQYHAFVRLVVGESGRFPQLGMAMIRNVTQPGIQTLSQYLASHPELELSDPQETAAIFLGALIYFILTQEILHGNKVVPRSRSRLIDSLIELILNHQ